jgi:hypothetical protein
VVGQPRPAGGRTSGKQANGGQGATVERHPGQLEADAAPDAAAEAAADDAELATYALGALDPAARARLEARLRAGDDPSLARRWAAFARAAGHLAYAARPLAPPAAAWDGLLGRIRGAGGTVRARPAPRRHH